MDTKIEVRNLRVSFRTNNGTVKAVRDISFSVDRGETLAIVGESGSGKSVTAKAILGILAGNSIVEGGEIIYDGQDLLKYTERDFNKIRGNRVTMIFQDPMSSLDPIMKIGKQMTEATILNGKTNRKNAAKEFKQTKALLKSAMEKAGVGSSEANSQLTAFEKLAREAARKEQSFALSSEYAQSASTGIDQILIELIGKDASKLQPMYKNLEGTLSKIKDDAVLQTGSSEYTEAKAACDKAMAAYSGGDAAQLKSALERLKGVLNAAGSRKMPDYYTDKKLLESLKGNIAKGMRYAENEVVPAKKKVIDAIESSRSVFEENPLDLARCRKASNELSALVDASINKLALQKNSNAYTFRTTMNANLDRYAAGLKKNPKEEHRVEREEKKREKLVAKNGDAPKVVPPVLVDFDLTRENMLTALDGLHDSLKAELASANTDDAALADGMLAYLKDKAYAMTYVVTKQEAYDKAISIMEDVGIKEPEKRFKQYPFEFSGGMRQRIVIAIAIAANPDILICDEPTTALDVTIQAQILELINDLKKKRNLTVIFITHDLGVVANMADKVAVMYAGKIVEYGTVDDVFYEPAHPYTWALLSSMPDLDTKDKLEAIPGTPPNMIYPPKGDAFAERNKYAMQIDFDRQPPMFKISDTHQAATWLLHPNAPKVDPPKAVTDRIERMKNMEEQGHE